MPTITKATTHPGCSRFGRQVAPGLCWRPRALWKCSTVEDYLDLGRDGVLQRIEDGRLCWAWRISAPRCTAEIRILGASAIEAKGCNTGLPKKTSQMTFAEVMEIVLPHHRPELRGRELQRIFSCTHQTITSFCRRRVIAVSTPAKAKDGPNSSPKYSRLSVISFFKRSRIL